MVHTPRSGCGWMLPGQPWCIEKHTLQDLDDNYVKQGRAPSTWHRKHGGHQWVLISTSYYINKCLGFPGMVAWPALWAWGQGVHPSVDQPTPALPRADYVWSQGLYPLKIWYAKCRWILNMVSEWVTLNVGCSMVIQAGLLREFWKHNTQTVSSAQVSQLPRPFQCFCHKCPGLTQ